jgi:hypothetical protein
VQNLTAVSLLLLLALALPACSETPSSRPGAAEHPPAKLPLISVPVGFHAAVAAILPAARIIEVAAGDTNFVRASSVIAIPDNQAPLPQGFSPMGVWLDDRLVLALRFDLGPADDTPVLPSPAETTPVFLPIATALDRLGFTLSDDGPANVAMTEAARDRFLQDDGESGVEWMSLIAVSSPAMTDSPLNALLEKRVEAAIFDPGTLARFLILMDHPFRDRVVFAELQSARRPLVLWVRTGDPVAFDTAQSLLHQSAKLESLGYARGK